MKKSSEAILWFTKCMLVVPFATSSAWSAAPPPIKFDHVHTYAEVVTYLTQVVEAYPQITKLHTIGKSFLGKDLLVLELKVPEVEESELTHELREMLPKFIGHVASFLVLGIYWIGHHNMFMHIQRHDRVLLWLNVLFLTLVASMPFPTGLIVENMTWDFWTYSRREELQGHEVYHITSVSMRLAMASSQSNQRK